MIPKIGYILFEWMKNIQKIKIQEENKDEVNTRIKQQKQNQGVQRTP